MSFPTIASADSVEFDSGEAPKSDELPPYLQCVPYARQLSGVQIYGDARTWWDQAAGRYKRGAAPRVGAVMTFRPSGNMVLGHVAAVSKVVDSRTVLLDHANWSPINGRRGQIERGVKAIDVSPANDWSQVRVWYAPLGDLGTTAWPVAGFIYNERDDGAPLARTVLASADRPAISPKPSKAFADAFASFGQAKPASVRIASATRKPAKPVTRPLDPIESALARYGS